MDKKYQIFISSTYTDLIEERQDVIKSVLDLEHIPSGMEAFLAADVEQFEYIKKVIDECDYYVLIIGARYGSLSDDGISFTEKEYEYAVNTGKVVLAFIHGNPGELPAVKSENDRELIKKLNGFKAKVSKGRLVAFWNSRDDLKAKVIVSLTKAMAQQPCSGWIRGDTAAGADILAQLNDVRDERDKLKKALEKAQVPRSSVKNLAGLNHLYTIRYKRRSAGSSVQTSKSLTFGDLFKAVGPDFLAPKFTTMLMISLTRHFRAVDGSAYDPILNADDVAVVRIQFEELGLLNFWIDTAGDKHGEAAQLTPSGKSTLVDLLAVRT